MTKNNEIKKRLKPLHIIKKEADLIEVDDYGIVIKYNGYWTYISKEMCSLFGKEIWVIKGIDGDPVYEWISMDDMKWYFMDEWFEKKFEIEPLDERLFEI